MDRFARQRLLATVGDCGQERIARATYVVDRAPLMAADIEREYLARAGAESFVFASSTRSAFAHGELFRNAAARDFAEGAWRALAQLRTSLEHTP